MVCILVIISRVFWEKCLAQVRRTASVALSLRMHRMIAAHTAVRHSLEMSLLWRGCICRGRSGSDQCAPGGPARGRSRRPCCLSENVCGMAASLR